jgi:hypothetical protein
MDYYINNKLSGVRGIVSKWTTILIVRSGVRGLVSKCTIILIISFSV